MITGKLHSYESCGTVDGPGLRYVVFTQGCPLRCKYCHNPDTWNIENFSHNESAKSVLEEIKKYKPFFKNGGGMTLTGGEPLLQPDFTMELFKRCKEEGIHTALDTSGVFLNEKVDEVLKYVDLVLLDLKCMDEDIHKKLTGVDLKPILKFAKHLEKIGKPVWIRHVLVPGITDKPELVEKLGDFIKDMKNVERMEILPYHNLGEYKWKELELEYELKDVEPPSVETIRWVKEIIAEKGISVR